MVMIQYLPRVVVGQPYPTTTLYSFYVRAPRTWSIGAHSLPPGLEPQLALHVLGGTGLTAYFGLLDVAKPVPSAKDTAAGQSRLPVLASYATIVLTNSVWFD